MHACSQSTWGTFYMHVHCTYYCKGRYWHKCYYKFSTCTTMYLNFFWSTRKSYVLRSITCFATPFLLVCTSASTAKYVWELSRKYEVQVVVLVQWLTSTRYEYKRNHILLKVLCTCNFHVPMQIQIFPSRRVASSPKMQRMCMYNTRTYSVSADVYFLHLCGKN